MIFVQETQHGQQRKMQRVTLTQDLTKLHQENSVQRYGYNVGLDQFLDLRICGIDMDRIIEFLSSMDEFDIAYVTDK